MHQGNCSFQSNLPKFKDEQGRGPGSQHSRREEQGEIRGQVQHHVPLLADADHEVAEKYGVWQQKSFMRPEVHGHRPHDVLIGPDGKVQKR